MPPTILILCCVCGAWERHPRGSYDVETLVSYGTLYNCQQRYPHWGLGRFKTIDAQVATAEARERQQRSKKDRDKPPAWVTIPDLTGRHWNAKRKEKFQLAKEISHDV